MIYGGDCLTKVDGKAVFVSQLLPGEKAAIEIIEDKKDFSRGKVIELLEPSVHRIKAPCPYYDLCGGCNLQIADDEYQRELRLSVLKDTFNRALGRDSFFDSARETVAEAKIIAGDSWAYRSRFQFVDGGLKERNSNRIVKLDHCPVATEKVNDLLKNGRIPAAAGTGKPGRPGVKKSGSRKTPDRNQCRVHVFEDVAAAENPGLKEIPQEYTVEVLGRKLTFDVRGFFQSNIGLLEKTIPFVCGFDSRNLDSPKGRLLDMYAGVGTFSAFAADSFEETVLVEHNRKALSYARRNVQGRNIRLCPSSGEDFTKTAEAGLYYDAVIIDPPRSGMEKSVCSWLCEKKPPIIRSVSCDPVTHARDAKILLSAGYRMTELFLLDFYPQTSHIESLVYFEAE